MIQSYGSIYNLGHKAVEHLFDQPVLVEEKIDGSQFMFGCIDGEVCIRSKRLQMIVDHPEPLFALAGQTVREIAPLLKPNYIYCGEFLAKPKHNALAYSRVPAKHIILFDVITAPGSEDYLSPSEKRAEATRLGLECVPAFHQGMVKSAEELRLLLDTESCLGGQKIEGVVIKQYDIFGPDKKALMGKFVSEAYKETQKIGWKADNPGKNDVVEAIITGLRTNARWRKAVEHLRDEGTLEQSPRDIGPLMKEVNADIERECEDIIKNALYKWALPTVKRGVLRGFPEWYKQGLLDLQFEKGEE